MTMAAIPTPGPVPARVASGVRRVTRRFGKTARGQKAVPRPPEIAAGSGQPTSELALMDVLARGSAVPLDRGAMTTLDRVIFAAQAAIVLYHLSIASDELDLGS